VPCVFCLLTVAHPSHVARLNVAACTQTDSFPVQLSRMQRSICAPVASAPALMRTLRGHSDTVRALSVSSDGTVLFSGSWDGSVRAWRATDGEELYALPAEGGAVLSLAQSADCELLFAGTESGLIRVWHGAKTRTLRGHTGPVRGLATPRRDFSAVASPRAAPHTHDAPLYSAGDDGSIRMWTGTSAAVAKCAAVLVPRGAVVSSSANGAKAASKKGPPALWCIVLSRDGTTLYAGGDDGGIAVWHPLDGAHVGHLAAHTGAVRALALSRDDASLFSCGEDRVIRRWAPTEGECVQQLRGHTFTVLALALSRDGRTLYSGGWDHTLRVWNLDTGQCIHVAGTDTGTSGGGGPAAGTHTAASQTDVASDAPVWALALSPDGCSLHSAASDCHVRTWRVASSPWPGCSLRGGLGQLMAAFAGSGGRR